MLAQNDVCPECGQVHPEPVFSRISGGSHRACPLVVLGAMPTMAREPEASTVAEAAEVHPAYPRRGSQLAVPWPMPTQWEDYL